MDSLYDKTTMQQLYHRLMKSCLTTVVMDSIEWIAEYGIPTDSKGVRITFDVNAEDVEVPDYLKKQFPEGMTINLQPFYQYEDLRCGRYGFAVTVACVVGPTKIVVSWESIRSYVDETSEFAIDLTAYFPVAVSFFGSNDEPHVMADSGEDEEAGSDNRDNVVELFPRGNDQDGNDTRS